MEYTKMLLVWNTSLFVEDLKVPLLQNAPALNLRKIKKKILQIWIEKSLFGGQGSGSSADLPPCLRRSAAQQVLKPKSPDVQKL